VLAPRQSSTFYPGILSVVQHADTSVRVYKYLSQNKLHHIVFSDNPQSSWHFEQWSSDAKIFYCCSTDGRITHLVLCDGTLVLSNGHPVITHPRRIDRLEWQEQKGVAKIFSSDTTALESFVADSFQTCVSLS